MRWIILVAAVGVGCGKDADSASKAKSAQESGIAVVGIWPKDWTCDKVASPAEIGQALGSTARLIEGVLPSNDGLPVPCNYMVLNPDGSETPWTFDVDCRPSYIQTADAIMAQWTQASSDNVARYNVESDAAPVDVPKPPKPEPGAETPDARPPARAPQEAHDVPVGRKAVDVLGDGIIFVDDDAPCYARVIGPDADRRLAMAQLVASRLTLANAPMTPRAAQ